MSFSCSCDSYAEFSNVTFPKNKKVGRRCHECREEIPVGAVYEKRVSKYDGDFASTHTCERCADLADSYVELGYCVFSGELWENHLEALEEKGAAKDSKAVMLAKKILRIEDEDEKEED